MVKAVARTLVSYSRERYARSNVIKFKSLVIVTLLVMFSSGCVENMKLTFFPNPKKLAGSGAMASTGQGNNLSSRCDGRDPDIEAVKWLLDVPTEHLQIEDVKNKIQLITSSPVDDGLFMRRLQSFYVDGQEGSVCLY